MTFESRAESPALRTKKRKSAMSSYLKRVMKQKKDENGYLTVEITLVFTVIFFALLLILFMGMVLYQQVNLQSLASRTSSRGSVIYASRVNDMGTGVKTLTDFKNRDPYRYIPLLDSGKQSEYKDLLNTYIAKKIGDYNVITGTIDDGNQYVVIEDYILVRRVKVNIREEYALPISAVGKMFGVESPFDINVTAVSTVTDPMEFIRNTDLCADVLKKTGAYGAAKEKMDTVQKTITEFMEVLQ